MRRFAALFGLSALTVLTPVLSAAAAPPAAGSKGSTKPRESGAAARTAGAAFVSPDETWTCSMPGKWDCQEGQLNGVAYLAFAPQGVPAATAPKLIFAFPGQLPPELAANSDATLLSAVLQQLVPAQLPFMTPKGEAKETKFGARSGAAQEYSGQIPGQEATLTLWAGLERENGAYLLVTALGKGTVNYAAARETARQMLETARPYQAPRNPALEKALLGRWSSIRSVSTSSTGGSSVTATYQFNPDGTFWRRITTSYSSNTFSSGLSGAGDNFDNGTYAVHGKTVVVKLRTGGELRLRVEGQLIDGQVRGLKIDGKDAVRGEV